MREDVTLGLSATTPFRYRRVVMRKAASGLVIGVLLSMLRAPLGIDLLQWPAVEARTAYGYRALAIGLAGLALALAGRRTLPTTFLVAIAAGFALHGLVLANVWSPAGTASLWISGCALCALAAYLGRESNEPGGEGRTGRLQRLGIAVAAAGVTLSLEATARHLRLFGAGLPQDDALFGAVLLVGLAAGAATLGWIGRSSSLRGLALPVALAFAAAGGYASLRVITSAATSRGLDQYLRTYGLDTSLHGMPSYDGLLAASCFIVPALLLGAALCSVTVREELFSVCIGAALALVVVPELFASDARALATDKGLFSSQLVPIATLVACAGAALALLAEPGRGARARWIALVLAVAPCALPLAIEVRPQYVLSPWQSWPPVLPHTVIEIPEGLVTVEPSRGGANVATLNRRYVTPATQSTGVDFQRMLLSLEALPPALRMRGDLRVLLVGQLTPERALALTEGRAKRVDRSAAWWIAMERLEAQMFGSAPKPEGEILAPSDARRRIAAGEYDLVIVPPIEGEAPVPTHVSAPATTVVVAWMELDDPLPRQDLGRAVIVSANGLDDPAIGLAWNTELPDGADATAPLVLAPGPSTAKPIPWSWLSKRSFQRRQHSRALAAERFAEAARGGPHEALTHGLAIFYGSQAHSSPFESDEQQVELPASALEQFQRAALERTPNVFVRKLWEDIARVLVGKRWIEEIYRYVEPIAARYEPWPALESAMAHADIESLDFESGIRRLTRLTELEPTRPEHWYALSVVQQRAEQPRDAIASLRRACALRPDHVALRRELALALLRAGDPEGETIADELLRDAPDDDELKRAREGDFEPAASSGAADPHDH